MSFNPINTPTIITSNEWTNIRSIDNENKSTIDKIEKHEQQAEQPLDARVMPIASDFFFNI